jgi:hypothetical protein
MARGGLLVRLQQGTSNAICLLCRQYQANTLREPLKLAIDFIVLNWSEIFEPDSNRTEAELEPTN